MYDSHHTYGLVIFVWLYLHDCFRLVVQFRQKRQPGRPPKEPFDPYREIPEDSHRSALNAAFEDGNISGYNGYLEKLKDGYGRLPYLHPCIKVKPGNVTEKCHTGI